MAHFQITIEKNEDMAREVLKGMWLKLCLLKMRAFFGVICKGLGKYHCIEDGGKRTYVEYSDDLSYLNSELKKFEAFMFSDYALLKDKHPEVVGLMNERAFKKLRSKLKNLTEKGKYKAIKAALGGNDVFSFITSIGISVSWQLSKED